MTEPLRVAVGDTVRFEKPVTEREVLQFAEISGDFYEAHTDEAAMRDSPFGQRIAHGALLVGLMSAAGTAMIAHVRGKGDRTTPVSLGYDRLRFVAPVFFGETIAVDYTVTAVDAERRRSTAKVEASKADGTVVAAAEHIMKWL